MIKFAVSTVIIFLFQEKNPFSVSDEINSRISVISFILNNRFFVDMIFYFYFLEVFVLVIMRLLFKQDFLNIFYSCLIARVVGEFRIARTSPCPINR